MSPFEFYRANIHYFLRIFYYRYINYVKMIWLPLFFFVSAILLIIVRVGYPQSIPFSNDVLIKIASTFAFEIILIIFGFLGLLAWKFTYITIYSLRKELDELPVDARIISKVNFLESFLKAETTLWRLLLKIIILLVIIILVFVVISYIIYVVISIVFHSCFGMPEEFTLFK
jgi:hypothetical protein